MFSWFLNNHLPCPMMGEVSLETLSHSTYLFTTFCIMNTEQARRTVFRFWYHKLNIDILIEDNLTELKKKEKSVGLVDNNKRETIKKEMVDYR